MRMLWTGLLSILFMAGGAMLLHGCGVVGKQDTIADLNKVEIEIKEEYVEGSLEKAMESYQKFLEETPEGALTPEAIRRLADLKIEKEYGVQAPGAAKVNDLAAETSKLESAKAEATTITPPADTAATAAAITAAPIAAIAAKKKRARRSYRQHNRV